MNPCFSIPQRNFVPLQSDEIIKFDSKEYGGFYISYNNYDIAEYGCATTALVVGQMQKFFILKGDHRDAYNKVFSEGFDACLSYYKDNLSLSHPHSKEDNKCLI